MPPTFANGKICYLEIPATDVARSSAFYKQVFGWNIRQRGDGSLAFDDGVGEVSGTWVLGRPPSGNPGLLLYIMVDRVARTVEAVTRTEAISSSPSAPMLLRSLRASVIPPEM